MLRYISFFELTPEHLTLLAESLLEAPEAVRPEADDLLRGLRDETMRAFEFDNGLLIVSVARGDTQRLVILAFAGSIWQRRQLVEDLRRLAADWECDMVETIVFNPRLVRAIERVGGRVESMTVTLAAEGLTNGQ